MSEFPARRGRHHGLMDPFAVYADWLVDLSIKDGGLDQIIQCFRPVDDSGC